MAKNPLWSRAAIVIMMGLLAVARGAAADDTPATGDAIVTQFSGVRSVRQSGDNQAWQIDPEGAVARVLSLQNRKAASDRESMPDRRPLATAAQVGQVFGIAMDDATPPNIYLSATSIYGLARSNDDWMEGQWGSGGGPGTIWKLDAADDYSPSIFANVELDGRSNSGPGLGNIAYDPYHRQLIVSDLETGMIQALAIEDGTERDRFDHGLQARSGFIDAVTGEARALSVVEFDTATAARVDDCESGPFVSSPLCWNLADFRRRVWGLGVQRDEKTGTVRVFYAVWSDTAFDNPAFTDALPEERTNSVWSVELDREGRFEPVTARLEFLVPSEKDAEDRTSDRFAISDIALPRTTKQQVIVIARHRGLITSKETAEQQPWADGFRPIYAKAENQRWIEDDEGIWRPAAPSDESPDQAMIGKEGEPFPPSPGANTAGGVDFGFGYSDDRIDLNAPAGFVWHTASNLCVTPGACEPEQEVPFGEEVPAWNMPDLAVDWLQTDPFQAVPGDAVTVAATVSNRGTGASEGAKLEFIIDGTLAESVDVRALAAGEYLTQRISWTADAPGLHRMQVEIKPTPGQVDGDSFNNRADRRVWVAGAAEPKSDIEFELPAGSTVSDGALVLRAINTAFATLAPVDATIRLDGERRGAVKIGPIYPGNSADIRIDLGDAVPGEHVVALEADWPDNLFDRDLRKVYAWHVTVPGSGQKALVLAPGNWLSLGPSILVKAQPDGSQGRVDHVVVRSGQRSGEPNELYASATSGGLWHSTDGGDNWSPLTDGLTKKFSRVRVKLLGDSSPLKGGAIALDPDDSNVVYYGTGTSRYGNGLGIFKSVDGGTSWHRIADDTLAVKDHKLTIDDGILTADEPHLVGVSALHVHRDQSGGVTIFAATNVGLLRLRSADPRSTTISSTDWELIQEGQVEDMAVDPKDTDRIYITVLGDMLPRPGGSPVQIMKGLFRCTDMDGAKPSCTPLTADLPNMATNASIRVDVYSKDTATIYASIARISAFAPGAPRLEIYRSDDRGDSWKLKTSFDDKTPTDASLYNPYIRVHPNNASIVWFGGVKLYKLDLGKANAKPIQVGPVHDDQHGLTFEPGSTGNSLRYYVAGDGGVWKCTFEAGTNDNCKNRNYDLRVMEFFDIDVAENEPSLIVGGTQDNGTQVFTGSTEWNKTYWPRGGDGAWTPMSPANPNVVISQHQRMHDDAYDARDSTYISTSGPNGPWIRGLAGSADIPDVIKKGDFGSSFITFRPNNPDLVAIAGDQIYATENATDFTTITKPDGSKVILSSSVWKARGPAGVNVHGRVTRIAFQPDTGTWYAGTSEGQIWRSDHGIRTTWNLIWDRDHDKASVVGMAFAPTDRDVLYVLFGGGDPHRRVLRLQGLSSGVTSTPMGSGFPENRTGIVISGDGYDADRFYVGTDRGVFQGNASRPSYDRWKSYNEGLPAIRVNDLVVPTGRRNQAAKTAYPAPERRLFAATRGRGVWEVDTGP